jgi:hypothetical protein
VPAGIESQPYQKFGLLACMTFGAMPHERIRYCAARPCSPALAPPKTRQYGRRPIDAAIMCFSCFVCVFRFVSVFVFVFVSIFVSMFVYVSVYDPLAERSMRLVLEEFAPAVKLAE